MTNYKAWALLDSEEAQLLDDAIGSDPDSEAADAFFESPTFEKLFDYFAFQTGEMPYDVAKGRGDVDPDVWIMQRMSREQTRSR
jgi:hypothetical protein